MHCSHSYYYQLGLAQTLLARLSNTLIKVTFFVFYLRLFGPKDHVRSMVWGGITVVVLFCVAFVITYLIKATPGKGGFLDPGYRAQMSKIPNTLITVAAYVSVITDFYTMIIPMHQIPKLGLSYKRKWGICFIFLTGIV